MKQYNGLTRRNPGTHRTWLDMIGRCHNPKRREYARYGGRGITVCDRWRGNFLTFLEDMGPRPPGHQIDRIDNDGPYAPGNCRWVTPTENIRNRGIATFVMWEGRRQSLAALAERYNVELTSLHSRLRSGWELERALTQPGTRGYFVRPSGGIHKAIPTGPSELGWAMVEAPSAASETASP